MFMCELAFGGAFASQGWLLTRAGKRLNSHGIDRATLSFQSCFPSKHIMSKLSIIIVSFNCRELVCDCIRSIEHSAGEVNLEIIVVDNASIDGSAQAIRKTFPDSRLIALDKNLGFGSACNVGAKQACGEYLLLLNPDTIVLPSSIQNLLEFADEYSKAGIWGGRTLNPDGSLNPKSCWRFPTLWSTLCISSGLARAFSGSGFLNREAYGGWARNTIRHVDAVSGCLFLIRKTLWDMLGGFDPIYFLYSEEIDLCLRARALGAKPMISPHVKVIHYVGGSQDVKSERFILLFQGKRTYMLKHWPPIKQWAGKILLIIWPLSRYVGYSLLATITRREAWTVSARSWKVVWQSRCRWIPGYEPH